MRYKYIYLFLVLFSKHYAQLNLVPNYSFENYSMCPMGFGGVSYATGWISPANSTPESYNVCSSLYDVSIPFSCCTYQQPKTGNGYAGIFLYNYNSSDTNNIDHEYIQTQLTQTLTANTHYYFEMYYSQADAAGYGTNRLQALFSVNQFTATYTQHFNSLQTQVELDSTLFITDTLNWVKLSGSFTAAGGERYLTIGNFKDGTRTHKVPLATNFVSPCGSFSNAFSYIYIDDVTVEQATPANAGNDTTIRCGDSFILAPSAGTASSYEWSPPEGLDDTDVLHPVASPSVTTSYVLKKQQGSIISYDTVIVTVNGVCDVGMAELDGNRSISVYPNPANTVVFVEAKGHEQVRIKLYNIIGDLVLEKEVNTYTALDVKDLAAGSYIYRVYAGNNMLKTGRLIIAK